MDTHFAADLASKLRELDLAGSDDDESDFDHCAIEPSDQDVRLKTRRRDRLLKFLRKKESPWTTIGAVSLSPKLFTSYQYPSLETNTIRILDLLPASAGQNDSAVHCRIREYRLGLEQKSHTASYCALSYAWGPTYQDGSHLTQKVVCGDHSLAVTANLHAALKRIRQNIADEKLPQMSLWVDALCINQRNDEERGQQVAMMYQIYSQASMLFIWLGDADESITANVERACAAGITWKQDHDDRSTDLRRHEIMNQWRSKVSRAEKESLKQLVQRPWFKRRWILQEVASAELASTRILLGDVQVPGENFVATLELLDLLKSVRAFRFTSSASRKGNILYNLQVFDEAECSNARDRIYALLNIAWTSPWVPGERQPRVKVNYAQTVEQCYYLFARIKAQSPYDVIGIMACATSRPSGTRTLPSWCPDWRVEIDYRSQRHQTACWRALDTACLTTDPKVVSNTLIVKGRILKPCLRVAKAQDFKCRDCATCIFARAALRTKEGLRLVAILAKDEAEDDDTSLLLFDDCSIAFWVRPKIVFLPPDAADEEITGSYETLYELYSCVEVPEYARDCHYITRRGDLMPLVEVAIA